MILSICDDPKILEITRLINLFVTAVRIIVPTVLIFALMFKLVGAIIKSDEDGLKKVMKIAPKNLIAAAIVFLIPTIVRLIVRFTSGDASYENCLRVVSLEEINTAYENKMEELLTQAEESESMDRYSVAYSYMNNIKDSDKRAEYEARLTDLKTKIDENKYIAFGDNDYSKVEYKNFKWQYYEVNSGPVAEYYSNTSAYAIWAPEDEKDLNGIPLPLIIFIHDTGLNVGQADEKTFISSGLISVINKWDEYKLDYIPAIIVSPQCNGEWTDEVNLKTITSLVRYTKEKYNIDKSKLIIMGHGDGGYKVPILLDALNTLTFYGAVIMSAPDVTLSYNEVRYFSSLKFKGYGEVSEGKKFFEQLGVSDDYTYFKDTNKSDIVEKAFTEDKDKDKVSDLIYWFFGDKARVTKIITSETYFAEGDGSLPGGEVMAQPPGERPISNYTSVSALNSALASTAKSNGLYTRNAVVSVAKTLINTLKANAYAIPYQMGGMYHRAGMWGVNPAWGTLTSENNLAGLDCRNFVIWTFKQAGLSLKRGLVYCGEGSVDGDCATATSISHRYNDYSMARPGDVLDHPRHIMLILSNNGNSFTVAEANGVGVVRIQDYSYDDLNRGGYKAYNMDAVYNNTAKVCSLVSYDRPYNGSCHIPRSEMSSYY